MYGIKSASMERSVDAAVNAPSTSRSNVHTRRRGSQQIAAAAWSPSEGSAKRTIAQLAREIRWVPEAQKKKSPSKKKKVSGSNPRPRKYRRRNFAAQNTLKFCRTTLARTVLMKLPQRAARRQRRLNAQGALLDANEDALLHLDGKKTHLSLKKKKSTKTL